MNLTNPIFTDKEAARLHLERIRWPNGAYCPHCGESENVKLLKGKSHRPGLYKCYSCKGHFSVTVGTVFERSRVPINKWILTSHLMAASKKGISAHQIHRTVGVTYKTAWFMLHRLREAMREANPSTMGGGGSTVEIDETYIGRRTRRLGEKKRKTGGGEKEKVFTLVERDGRARSFHVPTVTAKTLHPIIKQQIAKDTHVMSDEASVYVKINKFMDIDKSLIKGMVDKHDHVNHGIREYVRGDIHTNTIEGFFSIFKRGLTGVYQHCSKEHLKRYLCEFDFRYNYRAKLGYSDSQRADILLKGIEGKRLKYC
jgi:transposase-like protein